LKNEDFELRIIPAYHEEEVFDPKPTDTLDIVYQFIWQSKTWLYFGYLLSYEFYFFLFTLLCFSFHFFSFLQINIGFHVVLLESFYHSFMLGIWTEMHKFIGLLILLFQWQ